MGSILTSIKKLLGEEHAHFDPDITMHINSALMVLTQLGIGPDEGFRIIDDSAVWSDFIGPRQDLDSVISFVYLKTRLIFDPPQTGFLIEAIKDQIKELEWRLNSQVEGGT